MTTTKYQIGDWVRVKHGFQEQVAAILYLKTYDGIKWFYGLTNDRVVDDADILESRSKDTK